ncbi:hypothetical protein JTE90_018256 [Oedothorax gibbosus]|uniref:Uncharacterized protein n=1 Tax=Oedothorax gibbosus TaxID=931172 RepID=A0AAV6U9V8_9ARAC|nr:hypothetical protein JTE90_018256 [Oedothorax gibbosus]
MEVVIHKLAEKMDIKEVPLIQPGVGGKEKLKKRPAENSNNKIQLKKQKSINENMFKEVKQRILSAKAVQATTKVVKNTEVVKKHVTPCSFEHETQVLQLTLLQKEAELLEKGNELAYLQAKYNEQEENFANLKNKSDLLAPNDNRLDTLLPAEPHENMYDEDELSNEEEELSLNAIGIHHPQGWLIFV